MANINSDEIIDIKYDGDPFAMIPNDMIIDGSINPLTRLLYSIVKVYITIPNFVLYKATLIKALGCKSTNTFDKYWKELKDLGLLIQYKSHVNGRWKYSYKLLDPSQRIQDPKIWGVVQDPKKQGLEKQEGEIIEGFNNTDLNNTDLNNTHLNLDSINQQNQINEMINSLSPRFRRELYRLVVDVESNRLKSTKEDLMNYVYKLYKKNFIDSKGQPIKSLYGIVHSNFRIKVEQDSIECELLQKLADDGEPYAGSTLDKYYN